MQHRSIGIMSGTSADGIDVVLLGVEDVGRPSKAQILAHSYLAYPSDLRLRLREPATLTAPEVARLHFRLAELYAEAAMQLPGWQTASCVGLHGQTVVHEVDVAAGATPCTLQLGSSAVVAARLQLPIVGDLRAVDVALGGRGAPLVPFAHWFFSAGDASPALVVNFGGICNVTLVAEALGEVRGSDVGPGMMLSDAWASQSTNGRLGFDEDGTLSAGGKLVEPLRQALLCHPFVAAPAPKAAGREQFGRHFAEPLLNRFADLDARDVAYTLLYATVEILAHQLTRPPFVGRPLSRIVLTGGGARNPALVALCRELLPPGCEGAEVVVPETGPLAPPHHEPAAMALIALRSMQGLPSSLPAVTGASESAALGHVHRPPRAPRVTR